MSPVLVSLASLMSGSLGFNAPLKGLEQDGLQSFCWDVVECQDRSLPHVVVIICCVNVFLPEAKPIKKSIVS